MKGKKYSGDGLKFAVSQISRGQPIRGSFPKGIRHWKYRKSKVGLNVEGRKRKTEDCLKCNYLFILSVVWPQLAGAAHYHYRDWTLGPLPE